MRKIIKQHKRHLEHIETLNKVNVKQKYMELQKEKRKIMKQFEETAPENIKKLMKSKH